MSRPDLLNFTRSWPESVRGTLKHLREARPTKQPRCSPNQIKDLGDSMRLKHIADIPKLLKRAIQSAPKFLPDRVFARSRQEGSRRGCLPELTGSDQQSTLGKPQDHSSEVSSERADLIEALDRIAKTHEQLSRLLYELTVKDEGTGTESKEIFLPLADQALRVASQCKARITAGAALNDPCTMLELLLSAQKLDELLAELQSRLAPYSSLPQILARTRAEIEKFARKLSQEYFQGLFDDLSDYFAAKEAHLLSLINQKFGLAEKAKDTLLCPLSKSANAMLNVVNHVPGKMGRQRAGAPPSLRQRQTFLERTLKDELYAPLQHELRELVDRRSKIFNEEWEKRFSSEVSRLCLRLEPLAQFPLIRFDAGVDPSILVFWGSLGAAAAGTAGLAAGWHTLEYALANVFLPAAAVAVIFATFAMVLTCEKTREEYRERAKLAVRLVHQAVVLDLVQSGRLEEVDCVCDQNIEAIMRKWGRAVLGKLSAEDCRVLSVTATSFITALEAASKKLKNVVTVHCQEALGEL